jgi:hypothetical protein
MLAHYTHGFKTDKLEAQGAVLKKTCVPATQAIGSRTGVGRDQDGVSDGGRYRIRTYDFHRVKESRPEKSMGNAQEHSVT